jgi:hypothetical protein
VKSGKILLEHVMDEACSNKYMEFQGETLVYVNWGKCEAIREVSEATLPMHYAYVRGLVDARDYLLTHYMRCPTCRGKRRVKKGEEQVTCGTCEGRGGIAYLPEDLRK